MKKRIIYFSLLIIAIILISTSYFSYAFLTNKDELHGKLNMVVGTLDYKLESSDLKNNKITVNANTMEILNINLKSLNTIKSKYELYYKASDDNDLIIGYGDDSEAAGIVDANSSKKITVIIRNISDTNKEIEFGVQGGFINNELVLGSNKTTLYSYCNLNQEYSFDYTGSEQEFITPCTGQYKIEAWGAGNSGSVGYGGYTSGLITLKKDTILYVYVGEGSKTGSVGVNGTTRGIPASATFNGGGGGGTPGCDGYNYLCTMYSGGASGSGATDIRLTSGIWSNFDSLKSRIMVAGGSGGVQDFYAESGTYGASGGLTSYTGTAIAANSQYKGEAASQTCGYSFGIAGIGANAPSMYCNGHNGGGGGYYGGSGGKSSGGDCYMNGGGGGSSFISGHNGCDAIKEESTEDNIIHTGQPNHYSGLVFTDTIMIDGAGYNWTTEKGDYVGMPTHDGTGIMTGNKGNGYAKITYIAN